MDNSQPYFYEVKPVIVKPSCLESGSVQDCRNCKRNRCPSPRSWCVKPYPNRPKGCPNYDKKKGCPPNVPMFDEYFDLNKPVYVIINRFDVGSHARRMREQHPSWTERQCYNLLYWQGTARKQLRGKVRKFLLSFSKRGELPPRITACPEAMGVNVSLTLHMLDIELEWPARKIACQVAMAGYIAKKKISS